MVRCRKHYLSAGVERHRLAGTQAQTCSAANGLADAFQNPKLGDSSIAIESLGVALRRRKASLAVRMRAVKAIREGKALALYLEALTPDG
jgi:hypothetical protein